MIGKIFILLLLALSKIIVQSMPLRGVQDIYHSSFVHHSSFVCHSALLCRVYKTFVVDFLYTTQDHCITNIDDYAKDGRPGVV